MKFLKSSVVFLCLLFLFGGSAMALTINSGAIEVGGLDTWTSFTILSNSGNAEQDWFSDVFGPDAVVETWDTVASDWWLVDGETDVYAYMLPYESPEFFIKLGTGSTVLPTHIVYDNNDLLSWAVIDLSDWGSIPGAFLSEGPSIFNIGRVSHVGAPGAPVPEPSTLLLLGLGLVGMAGISRKRMKH